MVVDTLGLARGGPPRERSHSEPGAADRSFPFIGLSDADDPVRPVGRRPDEDDHRGVEELDCDEAILAVVLPVALRQSASRREHFVGPMPCRVPSRPSREGWQYTLPVSNSIGTIHVATTNAT